MYSSYNYSKSLCKYEILIFLVKEAANELDGLSLNLSNVIGCHLRSYEIVQSNPEDQ